MLVTFLLAMVAKPLRAASNPLLEAWYRARRGARVRRLVQARPLAGAESAQELKNKAKETLGRAMKAREDGNEDAFKTLWDEYVNLDKAADEAQVREDELKAAYDKYDAKPSDDRNPNDAAVKTMKPETASSGVQLGDGKVVAFADENTEGWIKGYPPDVQMPEIIRRLSPELRERAEFRKEAFFKYCRRGLEALDAKELKALQEGTDSEGGFLVPTDAVRLPVILARGVRGGRVSAISQNFTTSRDSGDWPASTDDVTWAAVAEEASFAESNPTLSQVPFTIRKIGRINKVSLELLEDSAVDIPALLGGLFTRGLGRYEDQQAIEGDGTTEPLGLRTTGATQGDISDITDLLTLTAPTVAEMINAFYELPEQWRETASWFTTSSFMARLAAIGSTAAGIHVFQELIRTEPAPTLLGKPIVLFDGTGWDDAATIGANEEVGAFGDFNQYFFIRRIGMTITRLDELYAGTDQVGFKARVRYDSIFAENDAFRILKGAAS